MPRQQSDQKITLPESRMLGIRAIDYQHAYFIDLYNELISQIQATERSKIALSPFLAEMFSYTDYHFKTEESLMAAVGYPELAAHRQEHRQFFDKLDDMANRLDLHRAELGELTSMIREWITDHIDVHDKHFGVYYWAVKAGRNNGKSRRRDGEAPPSYP